MTSPSGALAGAYDATVGALRIALMIDSDPVSGQITWNTGLGAIVHLLGPTDQAFQIEAGAGQNLGLGGGASIDVTITSTGQVGIGTSSPTAGYLLDVTGGTGGIRGVGTTGNGAYLASTAGYGGYCFSVTGMAIGGRIAPSSYNTVATVAQLVRSTTGTAAAGIGGAIDMEMEHSAGSDELAARIVWLYTDAGDTQEDSSLAFYTRHAGGTPSEAVRIDDLKNICIGVTTQDATLANGILMANGTAPTGVANTAGFYADSGDMYVFDAAGAATLLSPHDEAGNWIFRSRDLKTGRTLTIEVEKLLRALNEFFGTDYVHELVEAV